jgi:hypothetical protein
MAQHGKIRQTSRCKSLQYNFVCMTTAIEFGMKPCTSQKDRTLPLCYSSCLNLAECLLEGQEPLTFCDHYVDKDIVENTTMGLTECISIDDELYRLGSSSSKLESTIIFLLSFVLALHAIIRR